MSDPIITLLRHDRDCATQRSSAVSSACNCGIGPALIFYRDILARLEKAEGERDQLKDELRIYKEMQIQSRKSGIVPMEEKP